MQAQEDHIREALDMSFASVRRHVGAGRLWSACIHLVHKYVCCVAEKQTLRSRGGDEGLPEGAASRGEVGRSVV